MSWSKWSVSAFLDYVMVKFFCFGMSRLLQLSASAWLEYVMVKMVSFSISGLRHGQNREL
jgi:hypothetical protein